MKLLKKRVLLELMLPDEKTKGGIYIPEMSKKPLDLARVSEVADDCVHADPGDRVFFNRFAGTKLKLEGKEYLIVEESDLIAYVVEQKDKKE